MSRKDSLESMLDEALTLCAKYRKNFKELLKAHNAEKASADKVMDAQKKLIDVQKERIELLEEKIRLLEGLLEKN